MKVGIIDYGRGNLRSVQKAVAALGHPAELVTDAAGVAGLDAMIFPGQGAFGECVRALNEHDLFAPIQDWLAAGKPYMGICLGYQLLFAASEESPGTPGFGALPGQVVRFASGGGLKIPQMGWNTLRFADPADPAWAGLPASPYVYFVHSYYPVPADESAVASYTDYGGEFASSVRRPRLLATQFHPEKSQDVGLAILRNFVERVAVE
ncbi:MAG: imidazole glycerol phosphate synthase subunit HisH [Verrucomicrobiales bacterium]